MSTDSIYVMWSGKKQLSKVGLAFSPHARASQLRREKKDDSISLKTCWNIHSCGDLGGSMALEFFVHRALRKAGYEDPGNRFASEWFTMRWPATIELVEQCALLLAPIGVRIEQVPGSHI